MGPHQLSVDLPEALQGDTAREAPGAPQLPPSPTVGGSSPPAMAAPLPSGPLLCKRASRGATTTTESSLVPSSIREPEPTHPRLAGGSLGQSRPRTFREHRRGCSSRLCPSHSC